jgi:hypothetical protein
LKFLILHPSPSSSFPPSAALLLLDRKRGGGDDTCPRSRLREKLEKEGGVERGKMRKQTGQAKI